MQVIIQPSRISGNLTAPASKSAMQRACAAALVRGGQTVLHNPGTSEDEQAALHIIQQLGAVVEKTDGMVVITSNGIKPVSPRINCGESGLSVRMFTSIAAVSDQAITIEGSGSLVKRPLSFFDEVLPQLHVQCQSDHGFLPLMVTGPLQPKNIEVDGSLSSQFLTGLLFAYSCSAHEAVTITVKDLNSKPYIDLTLKVLEDFGLPCPVNKNYEAFYFDGAPANPPGQPLNYTIEGDWSGAAFLLVAGAIAGNAALKGLDVYSTQADKAILQALMQCGAGISVTEEQVEVSQNKLSAFHFNATDCPDLFPPLVALAAYCDGISVIEGVHRLAYKESNRAVTLQEEFGKMGVEISFQDNLMLIKGGAGVKGALVNSHHDHRIAMACGVAALKANGDTTIENAEAVGKSYPQFWQHLQNLNAALSLINN
jgi:3-phosphoshikimate 1-carboxyvinyltransferase